jgi:hypothetical protein
MSFLQQQQQLAQTTSSNQIRALDVLDNIKLWLTAALVSKYGQEAIAMLKKSISYLVDLMCELEETYSVQHCESPPLPLSSTRQASQHKSRKLPGRSNNEGSDRMRFDVMDLEPED